ncbi:SDR family oxidoreductase [Paenibacillus sp. S150]|uniref:SDR family oxidoreductase n=1 Tax=Paenibacillus sp. S150 TaxID=2749826 RepID=UPI001C567BF1|nr:SDR family oxidoreductase [Paenibacillus sp. S150]MBW4083124.1 SDR family oxidoreductase [Paenibacillus sp. S150]
MNNENGQNADKIALITGASSGFGLLTALALARKGYRVAATMRDLSRQGELLRQAGEAGVADRLHVMTLDVTDPASIKSAASTIMEIFGRIDVLVNNAGFAVGGFVEDVAMEEWRRQMDTNFFGLIGVTQAVLPIMRGQREGLIVNVSSVSGLTGFPGYAPYAASKYAVEGFSESLRQELLPFGIRVVLVEPASFRTPIWGKGIEGMHSSAGSPYQEQLAEVLRYSRRSAETAPEPDRVAELIARITAMKAPRLRYPVGKGSRLLVIGKTLLPWKVFEGIVAKSLKRLK